MSKKTDLWDGTAPPHSHVTAPSTFYVVKKSKYFLPYYFTNDRV